MTETNAKKDGHRLYEEDRVRMMADPELRAPYEEESGKKELWLQLVEARQKVGLTQAEVAKRLDVFQAQAARIEKRGYKSCNLDTLHRYLQALGDGFSLEVKVGQSKTSDQDAEAFANP